MSQIDTRTGKTQSLARLLRQQAGADMRQRDAADVIDALAAERDALAAKLAEVTAERDELRERTLVVKPAARFPVPKSYPTPGAVQINGHTYVLQEEPAPAQAVEEAARLDHDTPVLRLVAQAREEGRRQGLKEAEEVIAVLLVYNRRWPANNALRDAVDAIAALAQPAEEAEHG